LLLSQLISMKKTRTIQKIILLILLWVISVGMNSNSGLIPTTRYDLQQNFNINHAESVLDTIISEKSASKQTAQNVSLQTFVNTVVDGNSEVIRGVYSDGVLAFPVVQQPINQPGFVSSIDEVITEFSLSGANGVTGLLAHNYLAGKYFYELNIGDEIDIIYGDGEIRSYEISQFQEYQALQPNSPQSKFVDLITRKEITATELFKRVYVGDHHLTLQTCIQIGEIDSWGRIFIIANPV